MATSDAFYLDVKAEVDDVIDEFGTQYNVRGHKVYDPDQLESVAGSPRQVTGLVADQKEILERVSQLSGQFGSNWTAVKTLILKADANPQPDEEVEVESKWYPLSKLVPIKPADVIVLYMLDISR